MSKFNKLTLREEEILTILQEEATEVALVCSKIIRFGFDSYHPNDPSKSNTLRLVEELGDLFAMMKLIMDCNNRITEKGIIEAATNKLEKLKKFSRHIYDDKS